MDQTCFLFQCLTNASSVVPHFAFLFVFERLVKQPFVVHPFDMLFYFYLSSFIVKNVFNKYLVRQEAWFCCFLWVDRFHFNLRLPAGIGYLVQSASYVRWLRGLSYITPLSPRSQMVRRRP